MSSFALWPEMSSPPTTMLPSVADRIPPAMEHSVVLPEPDGPTSATISSLPSVSVAWSSATTSEPSPIVYTLRTADISSAVRDARWTCRWMQCS